MTNRHRSVGKDLAVTFFLFIIASALFCPLLLQPDALIYNLDIDYFFAHEVVIEHSLALGDFPLWNPYFGAGSPTLSKIQIGHFYPPMVLLRLLLPVVARLNWDAALNVYIAGLGVYWLTRDLVRSRIAAVYSAIAFMLSGSIMPRVFAGHESVLHVVAWTGWLLFAYRRMLYRPSWWYVLLSALFSACTVLGGHPQMSAIVLLVPASYFVFPYMIESVAGRRWSELLRGLGLSLLVALLTAGLTAVQLIPYAEWLPHTQRGTGVVFDSVDTMIRNSFQLQHLLTLFVPLAWFQPESAASIHFATRSHFWEVSPFVGVVTLLLIVSGLKLARRQNHHLIVYFMGMAAFGLIMGMGTYNPVYHFILEKLPFFRAPGRILILWTFSVSILAGISLDGLLVILNHTEKRPLFRKATVMVSAVSLITIALVVSWNVSDRAILSHLQQRAYLAGNNPTVLQALLQRSATVLAVTLVVITALFWSAGISAVTPRLWSWLAIAVVIFELILFARPLVRPYPITRLIDPQNPLAKLKIDPGEVRIDGYRTPPNYLVPTLVHVRNGEEHVALIQLLTDRERGRKLLSASYYAETGPIEDPSVELVQKTDLAFLYRHVDTSPRIYASESTVLADSDDQALDFVQGDSFNQFEQSVLTLSRDDDPIPAQVLALEKAGSGKVGFSGEYTAYGNDRITAQVLLDRPAMVVFSELYYPGWQATVDGEPARIYKSNYALRGVAVEEGEHIITMRFSPPSFRVAAILSLLTVGVIAVVSLWLGIGGARQNKP